MPRPNAGLEGACPARELPPLRRVGGAGPDLHERDVLDVEPRVEPRLLPLGVEPALLDARVDARDRLLPRDRQAGVRQEQGARDDEEERCASTHDRIEPGRLLP